MTERWHRTANLVGLPGMPKVARPIRHHGAKRGWTNRLVVGDRRGTLEWLESSLPPATQAALRARRGEAGSAGGPPCAGTDGGGVAPSPPPSIVSGASLGGAGGAIADARQEIVTAFEAWRRPRGIPLVRACKQFADLYRLGAAGVSGETHALIPTFSWNTLQRWRAGWLDRGILGLVPETGGRRAVIDADPDFREEVAALVFANPDHITARQIGRTLAARYPGKEQPGIDAIRRWVRGWRERNRRALSAVADPDGHRSRRTPAFGNADDLLVHGLNALWELDSTTADVMCVDGKRHALVAGIDVWSRRVKVIVTPTSKSAAIAALVRKCLLDWGVPTWVTTDEGSDYTSRHMRSVLRGLGVGHQVLPPYSPDLKPFIERFIGTLSRDLLAQLPGFTGHNVAQAQKLRNRKSFAARRGEQPVATFRCQLTAEELQARIDGWCENVYGREPHSGLSGRSPFEQAASWNGERKRVDERALDILLAEPVSGGGTRTVQKDGLHVEGGIYIAAALGPLVGERVHVRRDPADYGRVYVFEIGANDAMGPFICLADDPVRTGIDREEVARDARRLAREADRDARKWARDLAKARQPVNAIDDVLDHAAAEAGRLVAFPARAERHESDGLAAAAAAQDAADEADAPAEQRQTGTAGSRSGTGGGGARVLDAMRRFYRENDDG